MVGNAFVILKVCHSVIYSWRLATYLSVCVLSLGSEPPLGLASLNSNYTVFFAANPPLLALSSLKWREIPRFGICNRFWIENFPKLYSGGYVFIEIAKYVEATILQLEVVLSSRRRPASVSFCTKMVTLNILCLIPPPYSSLIFFILKYASRSSVPSF